MAAKGVYRAKPEFFNNIGGERSLSVLDRLACPTAPWADGERFTVAQDDQGDDPEPRRAEMVAA